MAADSPSSFLPGFDFLKSLASQAGKGMQGMPGMQGLSSLQQWVTPVLDPDELDKRIEELRTVHFWLEQNAKLLSATIQALEVQKMTLTTLRSMNVPMPDLKSTLRAMGGAVAGAGSQAGGEPARKKPAAKSSRPTATKTGDGTADGIDPMAWWGSLTEQFAQIAAKVTEGAVNTPASEGPPVKKGASSEPGSARTAKSRKRPSAGAAGSSGTKRSRTTGSGS